MHVHAHKQACALVRTSTLLQQELHAPLVFLLLLREPTVGVELCAIQGVLQPLHQPLLVIKLHFQLRQGELKLTFLLTQRHHLQEPFTPTAFSIQTSIRKFRP